MNRRFEAYEVSLDILRALRPVLASLQQRDHQLAGELCRAATSVPTNLAEGARHRGADRLFHYQCAAGDAAAIRSKLARAALPDGDAARAQELLGRVMPMISGLLHAGH
jgi:four helix bundle protein